MISGANDSAAVERRSEGGVRLLSVPLVVTLLLTALSYAP